MTQQHKLKSLALILRSLAPETQKKVFEMLPLPVVQKISEIDLSIDESLSDEDWNYFAKTWPEFFELINSVHLESKKEKTINMLETERPKIKEYLEYKLGRSSARPNISHALLKIIDEVALGQKS